MKTEHNSLVDVDLHEFPDHLAELIRELGKEPGYIETIDIKSKIISKGEKVLPFMYKLLLSGNPYMRKEAAQIIRQIAGKRSIPVLINMLEDEDSSVRWAAAEGLIDYGKDVAEPLLKAILNSKNLMLLRNNAHFVLNNVLKEDEKKEIASLMTSLKGDSTEGVIVFEALKALNTLA